jgi:hypothetical protein
MFILLMCSRLIGEHLLSVEDWRTSLPYDGWMFTVDVQYSTVQTTNDPTFNVKQIAPHFDPLPSPPKVNRSRCKQKERQRNDVML